MGKTLPLSEPYSNTGTSYFQRLPAAQTPFLSCLVLSPLRVLRLSHSLAGTPTMRPGLRGRDRLVWTDMDRHACGPSTPRPFNYVYPPCRPRTQSVLGEPGGYQEASDLSLGGKQSLSQTPPYPSPMASGTEGGDRRWGSPEEEQGGFSTGEDICDEF